MSEQTRVLFSHDEMRDAAWAATADALAIAQRRVGELEATNTRLQIENEYQLARAAALSTGVGLARLHLSKGDVGDAVNALEDAVAKCPDIREFTERVATALAQDAEQENA